MKFRNQKNRIIREFRYRSDQQGIINRYLREKGGWDSHLKKCRDYILESVLREAPSRISVLGSGWLLDIPIDEIAEKVDEIFLVDIIHPPQVIHRVTKHKGIQLIEEDITGGLAKKLFEKAGKSKSFPDELIIEEYIPSYEPGMVLSVNVLTQLDSLLVEWLERKGFKSDSRLTGYRRAIHRKHIDFLRKHRSLLITEYGEELYRDNEFVRYKDLIFEDLPDGKNRTEWSWNFDTTGSYYDGLNVVFKVAAMRLYR